MTLDTSYHHTRWSDMKDRLLGMPGTPERIAADKEMAAYMKKEDRLDKIFGWMLSIPPYFPKDLDDQGYDFNRWKGLGPLMYLFWRTLADEGFYGMLDMLSFHYFNDKYVMKFSDIRKNRKEARNWRKGNATSTDT